MGDGGAVSGSIRGNLDGYNFTFFALGHHFEGPATDLAIGIEALMLIAGVNDHFTILATVGALDVGEFFHGAIYTPVWRKCKWLCEKVVHAAVCAASAAGDIGLTAGAGR